MCAPTSEDEHRVIAETQRGQDLVEDTMLMAQEPFASAEIEYRRSQIARSVGRRSRHRVRRRASLRLPPQRPLDAA